MDSRQLVDLVAHVAEDRKAEEVVTLDMQEVTLVADYFVIMGGKTTTQVDALADHIERRLQEVGVRLLHREGKAGSRWVLLDYGGVVIHIFTEDERRYYDLERLWGDARIVSQGS